MKVMQFLCGRAWGGACVVVLAITRALIARGDEVWVLSFEEETDRRFLEAGARLVRPPFWFRSINPTDLLLLAYFWELCRKEKFDLVATHTSKGGFLGRIAARLARVPHIVHHAHGFSFRRPLSPLAIRYFLALERIAAKSGDLIIAVNEHQRRMAVELGVEAAEKTCTIPNGIDLSPFGHADRDAIRRKLGFDSSAVLIGAVGRMEAPKGFPYLLRAIPEVVRSIPSAQFIIAGDGELRPELENEARRAGIADRAHFIGFQRDVPDLLAGLDIFTQPSLWEGLPISLIEALAAGKPIVATDIEGNREIVDDGRTGLIVPPGDSRALAAAIVSLASDPARAKRLGRSARTAALERFSERRMVRQVLSTYDRLVMGTRYETSPRPVLDNSTGVEHL
jgi:glycosyltransferase involved in cell wall biosynthesis